MNIYFKFQATMMQQMYANYMTQYIQYLQSVGAMYQMPSANTQDVVDHPNQITDEARAALGVGRLSVQSIARHTLWPSVVVARMLVKNTRDLRSPS